MKTRYRLAAIALAAAVLSPLAASAASDDAVYTYDLLNRLATVTYDNGTVINYSYDAAGNRTAYVVTGTSAPLLRRVAPSPATKSGTTNPERVRQ